MYIKNTLYWIYKQDRRKFLFNTSKQLSHINHKSSAFIMLDMLYCSLVYGCMFTEYGDLQFYYRSRKNRKTYLTTFYNFDLYDKVNDKGSRILFHDKLLFLHRFSKYIKRGWLNLDECNDSEINTFLEGKKSIVLKASYGDSGKEVLVMDIDNATNASSIRELCKESHFNLVEECVINHNEISRFNKNSLNTLRIVSMLKGTEVKILFAGLRVGAKDARIDNISQGGRVARINIETGTIDSPFFTKKSSNQPSQCNNELNAIGFEIPYWHSTLKLVNEVALEAKETRFIAWDIAITPSGPEIIEANESFGSVIMQLYNKKTEDGLKPIVEKFFK